MMREALLVMLAGCTSDRECGFGDAPAAGIVAKGDGVTLTYGAMTVSANNDCPFRSPQQEGDIISVSVFGAQVDDPTLLFTICVERPDQLSGGLALGVEQPPDHAPVHLIDIAGSANGCTFKIDRTVPATGKASASGVCGNGDDPAGFALVFDGGVTLQRTCGATVDSVAFTLSGTIAVAHQ